MCNKILMLTGKEIESMSNLIRWNPIREMLTMNEAMDRLFDNAFVVANNGPMRGKPRVRTTFLFLQTR